MTPLLLLALLFLLTIGHLLTLKVCSLKLDHRAAPLFISVWTLIGLLLVSPVYGHLLQDGFAKMADSPWLAALCAVKAVLLCVLLVVSQRLMKESLSSRHYVTPLALGVMAVVNHFLGEVLTPAQWAAALGLCVLSAAFFFKGHLSELSKQGRVDYITLVALTAAIGALDHTLTKDTNWYTLLLATNVVLLALAVALNRRAGTALNYYAGTALKAALLNRPAMLAGMFYAATELVKFYQMVTINPVTAVVMTQAMTKPVILALSALVWKERTVKEQLAWGLASFALVVVPFVV